MGIKILVLRLWAQMQHSVELGWGRLLVLFGLNFFTIAWQNIHMYKSEQLAVLGVDALFLLAGVTIFVILLDLVPGSAVPSLPEFNGRMQDEHTLEVELDKSQSLNSLFEQLSAQGVKVLSMRNKANRLEELFVNLVEEGRKA